MLSSAGPSAAATIISISDGDVDGFGGTQGVVSNDGDPFTPFATPTVAPGTQLLPFQGGDRTTIAPWKPYGFEFSWFHDVLHPTLLQSTTLGILIGGVARRADSTGFGYATVTLADFFTNDSIVLGDLLEIDTGAPESMAENTIRMVSWDITSFVAAHPEAYLVLTVDGTGLANPGDQFAIDYAIITDTYMDAPTTTLPPTTTTSTTLTSTTTTTLASTTTTTLGTTTTTLVEPEPVCGDEPRTGCFASAAGKASVQLSSPTDPAKRKLKWKWKGADAVAAADFGDPAGGTPEYTLCVYDSSVRAQPFFTASIPTGTCGTSPCWKAAGSGFKFKDKSSSPDGVSTAMLKPGAAGKAQVKIGGKGSNLDLGALSLANPVTVQLVVDNGTGIECWQTEFSSAKVSDEDAYKAK